MNLLLKEIRHNPLLWLLAFVPVLFAGQTLKPGAHTLLFVLSVLAIVPLATLLSHATESVAAKTGDAVGGLLNATLGNLTELVIALAALRAGEYALVKASIAGAIVTNTLFMLGVSFLLGGLKYHVQEYNRVSARVQAALLFLATVALLIPSATSEADSAAGTAFTQTLSAVWRCCSSLRTDWACCSRSRRTASCSPGWNPRRPAKRRGRSVWPWPRWPASRWWSRW